MKLTFLVENHTTIDQYYLAEPALSVLVQDGDRRILLDTGYSDAFVHNAQLLGEDLADLDYLVLSHGHFDHTWGLPALIRYLVQQRINNKVVKVPQVIAHPLALADKMSDKLGSIGSLMSEESVRRFFPLTLEKQPVALTDKVFYLGEIPDQFDFEKTAPKHQFKTAEGRIDDPLIDDTSLALLTPQGLVLLCGCAHRGVCSTLRYAMEVTKEDRVVDVIGGFHLLNAPTERLEKTVAYLKEVGLKRISPCHCVDLAAKVFLGQHFDLREVGAGSVVDYLGE